METPEMNSDRGAIYVIIGAGHAGCETARTLRRIGFAGRILLLSAEPFLPYRRPPLSKQYLGGSLPEDQLTLIRADRLSRDNIEFLQSTRVEHIDRLGKRLYYQDQRSQHYDKLAIATGGAPRLMPTVDPRADNVFYMRTMADAKRMRANLVAGMRLLIIGGGFIGLEVAAVARAIGLEVTIVEKQERILARVTCEEVSKFFRSLHARHGVSIETNNSVSSFVPSPDGRKLIAADLSNGERINFDLMLVSIGQQPRVELARDCGLRVDNGVLVNEHHVTSDEDIFAAGDCANFYSPMYKRRLRLESMQSAVESGQIVAHSMMSRRQDRKAAPWFWSDQYDAKLQIAGVSDLRDSRVVHGDPESGSFSVFYARAGVVVAADCVGRPEDFMLAKRLIESRSGEELIPT